MLLPHAGWPLLLAPLAVAEAPAAPFDHEHSALSALLGAHVRGGSVDYEALRRDRRALDAYLNTLAATSTHAGWSEPQRFAFWINAYNAYTLALVLDNPGVASIRDIGWPFSPWKRAFIPMAGLRGAVLTLDDIEHNVIRVEHPDPRLHMALVCASRSCPPLRAEAYTAAKLDAQLDEQARVFLNDRSKNHIDIGAGTLALSKIFSWYGADFERVGGVNAFVARYLPPAEAAAVRSGQLTLSYLAYDWSLNDVAR